MNSIKNNQSYTFILIFLTIFSIVLNSCKDEVPEDEISIIIESPINFQAKPDSCSVKLSWENPSPQSISGFLLLRNQFHLPNNTSDGIKIYSGLDEVFEDVPLINGTRYYYAVYSFDNNLNYSEASYAAATPIDDLTNNDPFIIYMSPNGSDYNDGLSENSALLSLAKVQERLKILKPIIDCDIEVRIKFIQGSSFIQQSIDWTHTSHDHTISFMPLDYNYGEGINDISGRPVFDGNGTEDWFFDLRVSSGNSNIRFYYIKVQEYIPGGIRFYGNKYDLEKWNGYNTVIGCYFYEIGNKKYPSSSYGFGAIDFVNSDNNFIRNNHFINCENKSGDDASHMHGIYLAHNSSDNQIEYNRFLKISGDPVRVRDYSNHNLIYDNDIEESGKYAYYSTYRNAEVAECRSWENEFRDNTVNCGYSGEEINLFRYFVRYNGNGALEDGPQYPDGDCQEFSNWLYTSGNIKLCN